MLSVSITPGEKDMTDVFRLRTLESLARPSVADQVFDELHGQVVSLELPPGAKLSEVDVARQMGVSRQPVRDAFYRLSKLGFLLIRPQRATTVTQISASGVLQARFVRVALEIEVMREACRQLTDDDFAVLDNLIALQDEAIVAGAKSEFHALDDGFHKEICERSGLAFAWDLIRDHKAHMDRVRFLSLSFASRQAYDEHVLILDALKRRDAGGAGDILRQHLGRIESVIEKIRSENHSWFAEEE